MIMKVNEELKKIAKLNTKAQLVGIIRMFRRNSESSANMIRRIREISNVREMQFEKG